jgi:hypothetical protein
MHTFVSQKGSLAPFSGGADCARSVHERAVLSLLGLAFERKQIPRFVVNASS